jgi:hypothetical protein
MRSSFDLYIQTNHGLAQSKLYSDLRSPTNNFDAPEGGDPNPAYLDTSLL